MSGQSFADEANVHVDKLLSEVGNINCSRLILNLDATLYPAQLQPCTVRLARLQLVPSHAQDLLYSIFLLIWRKSTGFLMSSFRGCFGNRNVIQNKLHQKMFTIKYLSTS